MSPFPPFPGREATQIAQNASRYRDVPFPSFPSSPEEPRQVDVCIRYKTGEEPTLVTVECRKRKSKSDVEWIDELKGKKEAIKADRMIAVCFKGLSAPALKKAQKKGIEVRNIREITHEEIASWCELTRILYSPPPFHPIRLHLFDDKFDYIPFSDLDAKTRADLKKSGHAAPIVYSEKGGASFIDIVNQYQAVNAGTECDLLRNVPAHGTPEVKFVSCKTNPAYNYVRTKHGPRKLGFVLFAVQVVFRIVEVPAKTHYAYTDTSGTLIEGVEFHPEGPKAIAVNLSKAPGAGIKATLMLKDDPKPAPKPKGRQTKR
jgi:hypothetical protein